MDLAHPTQYARNPTQLRNHSPAPVYGSEPLAIHPHAIDGAVRELQAAAADVRMRTDATWHYQTFGNVAVIDVRGALWSWSYDWLAEDLSRAVADETVTRIVLSIDSPGGMVHGAGETAALVRKLHAEKPIVAYVSGSGCSAAYLIAAAAGEIAVAESAEVGCIGVVTRWIDDRAWQDKTGLKSRVMVSSQTPDKDLDPNDPDGARRLQMRLDEHAQIFIDQLAALRGVSSDAILREYGAGATFVGRKAVEAGLAESVTTLDALINSLQGAGMPQVFEVGRLYQATSASEAVAVDITADALAAVPGVAAILDGVRAAEKSDAGQTVADAIKAERARVSALLALRAPGTDAMITEAVASGETAEACALRILRAQADRGVTLDALRGEAPAPVAGAPAPAAVASGWDQSVSRVSGSRK